ncbi:hypothetical protein EHQ76_04065 [Leptospira barantonii]|uniref:TIGR04452 family lipoprotein n=1 Tax=Leptospira barantonii TaxID=2023184 RepID=A0A5F2BRR9_9LEPT|nr:hypothetical protein [Leptospira barantonii]TGM07988.1 hypothetical protein EHQ76_04065 [Leptospira barantonii]
MTIIRRSLKTSALLILICSLSFSCNTYYRVTDKHLVPASDAMIKIDLAILIGILSLPDKSLRYYPSTLTTGGLITLITGLGRGDVQMTDLFEKDKVEECATSITAAIVLGKKLDAGYVAAANCKLKKVQ